METTERKLPPFGQPAAAQAPVGTPIWGARWIWPDDQVYNRQGFNDVGDGSNQLADWLNAPVPNTNEAHPILLAMEKSRGMADAGEWEPSSWDVKLLYEDDRGVIYGTPSRSYGYVYVAGWLKPTTKEVNA